MPFHPFSREHFVTVAIGALIVAGLLFAGRCGGKWRTSATALLVAASLTAYPISLAAWLSLGKPVVLDNLLPFHLCDIAAITAGLALLTKRHLLCSLTYFWGLAATIQALLTPAISVGFPAWPFITFFTHHFAIVATAFYLPIVLGWRPKQPLWREPLEIYGWSVAYLVFALAVNAVLHTNFGFASRPPDNPSLIDHLGPWPWYLFAMQAIAVVLYFLLVLPFCRRRNR
jgi:hypothetical integral membrane protein (TIGR02206 family)